MIHFNAENVNLVENKIILEIWIHFWMENKSIEILKSFVESFSMFCPLLTSNNNTGKIENENGKMGLQEFANKLRENKIVGFFFNWNDF